MNEAQRTPVETLREHASRLEAAMLVALARPKPKAVHALRSESRRIEAQLELLSMVPDLPAHRGPANEVLGRLRKMRSAAGKVRDCDVHRKLLKDGGAQLAAAPEATRGIEQDGKKLRKDLGKRRERLESKLVSVLGKGQSKLARAVEELLDALKPGEEARADEAALLAGIGQRFERVANANTAGEEHLHEVRKAAKRARYQCEGLAGEQAAEMARQFENLQDAGGVWHDLLELARCAYRSFGPDHPLSHVLEHRRDQSLDRYAELLAGFRAAHPQPEGLGRGRRKQRAEDGHRAGTGHRAGNRAGERVGERVGAAAQARGGKSASGKKKSASSGQHARPR